MLNVIIRKSGTVGYENNPIVALQGHTDMVCEKNFDVKHDFSKDPIKLVIDGDRLTADGTTLGADNGTAVSIMLALLADKVISHPPLECIFTSQEEIGLIGASAILSEEITAKSMINLDCGSLHSVAAGCAGGVRANLSKTLTIEKVTNKTEFSLMVKGLQGGHSGGSIVKGLGNSLKITSRILKSIFSKFDINLVSMDGGSKDNAIPRECMTKFLAKKQDCDNITSLVATLSNEISKELIEVDPNFTTVLSCCEATATNAISTQDTANIINFLFISPNGVRVRDNDKNYIISSLNCAVAKISEATAIISFSCRSSIESLKQLTKQELITLGETFGFAIQFTGEYPGWGYEPNSPLRTLYASIHDDMFDIPLQVDVIHAGLECGLFKSKKADLDIIAVSPNVYMGHTPEEYLEISSMLPFWQVLTKVLAAL